MERIKLFEWVKGMYGTEPDYPWNDWNAVLRHAENKKWYALIMEVPAQKLGLDENRIIDILNVKCDPLLIGSLRSKSGYFPAYHMNKEKWLSIALDGSVQEDEIKDLLDMSYKRNRQILRPLSKKTPLIRGVFCNTLPAASWTKASASPARLP